MEVTRRESIGEDIEAPVGRDAGANYALVRCLRFGDVVLHYKTDAEAILGASIVTGDPEPASTYWAAHDGKEQKANARPAWLPGIRVPIDHLVEVDPPITLDELRRHENDLMAIRDDLQQRYPKAPLYFPWARYRGGSSPMRTLQSYLVKFPRAAVDVIPRLRAVVDMAQGARIGRVEGPSELELAQAAIATSAGRRYARRGQGFLVNQKMSVAIEVLAMNCAIRHYRTGGWTVHDVHGVAVWDLECNKEGKALQVIVKGSPGKAQEVVLTPDEVAHITSSDIVALFILAEIDLFSDAHAEITARGGKLTVAEPWHINVNALVPIGYRYCAL